MKFLLFNLLGPEMFIILFLAVMIPAILYILTINQTLDEIRKEYKLIPSRSPLLLFIPIFGNIFLFIVVIKLSQSLEIEFEERGILAAEKKPGLTVGLIMSISFILFPFIRIMGLVGLVCWIIHWVKISTYKRTLIDNSINVKES